jgi:hypothetical protein
LLLLLLLLLLLPFPVPEGAWAQHWEPANRIP